MEAKALKHLHDGGPEKTKATTGIVAFGGKTPGIQRSDSVEPLNMGVERFVGKRCWRQRRRRREA
jgi:hypothetical protein